MSAATSVNATFVLQQFALSVSKDGNGSGTVTSNPAGISCGGDCIEAYDAGTVVTLTPAAAANSTFAGWSGACTGVSTCQVTMTQARSVNATFTLQQFTLSASRAGTGSGTVTSSPVGISCGVDCTESYNAGTQVTLSAAPAAGSVFTGWSGACAGTGSCVVTMTGTRSVTATFALQQFPLTVTKTGSGSGAVTSTPSGISCGVDCSEIYDFNTQVTLTATPALGSDFTGWSGACTGTGSCVVTMTGARSVTATFDLE